MAEKKWSQLLPLVNRWLMITAVFEEQVKHQLVMPALGLFWSTGECASPVNRQQLTACEWVDNRSEPEVGRQAFNAG